MYVLMVMSPIEKNYRPNFGIESFPSIVDCHDHQVRLTYKYAMLSDG